MDKADALQIMLKSAAVFKENFSSKKLLVVYGEEKNPNYIEIKAVGENFVHLTGVVTSIPANDFYNRLLDNRISQNDFQFKSDGTTQLKLSVIESILNIKSSAQMFGDYNGGRPRLYTKKLMGNVAASIGFVPAGSTYFVPNTILKGDVRNDIIRGKNRVLVILAKPLDAKEYDRIVKVAKKVSIDDVLKKISAKVRIADSILHHDRNNAAQEASNDMAKKAKPKERKDDEPMFSMSIIKSEAFSPTSSKDKDTDKTKAKKNDIHL